MRVSVEYMSLIRDASGVDAEDFDTDADPFTLADLLGRLVSKHGDSFRAAVLDEQGVMHAWLMVTVNDTLLRDPAAILRDGDRVTLAVPISGG